MESTAQAIIRVLENEEIEYVFGYPGGRVIELFEELPTDHISVVRPRDEREASVMAEMHGRLTSSPAVLMGQGPWIGSLGSIGQMEARLGSSPMIVITEASERGDYSTLAPYQQARGDYGGLDLQSILDGITKEHWFPRTPTESIRSVQLAIKHTKAGRPGPTAVILDGNAVTEEVPENPTPQVWETTAQTQIWDPSPTAEDVEEAITALQAADRPVIIAGNGVHQAQAYASLEGVARTYNAIVVTSYLGKSTIAETHPLAAGVIGSFGHEGANQVVSEADTILVVGCRLNPMDTNWQAPSFIRPDEQTIIHADIDARNAGWVYPADVGLIGDASETLSALVQKGSREANGWAKQRATEARTSFTTAKCSSDARPIKPQRAVQ
ncbi:MAG: thiamine pyrophosphate-binding protein, partial [Halobacteriaceae archaeon]